MTYYIGIDIGVHGGLAVIDSETKEINLHEIPVTVTYSKRKRKNRKTGIIEIRPVKRSSYDKRGMKNLVKMYRKNSISCLESVHSKITDGAVQAFLLGKGAGLWEGLLEASEIKCLGVAPQTWKKYYELIGKTKKDSINKALELYPQIHDKLNSADRENRDGLAEALLLAHYGMKNE